MKKAKVIIPIFVLMIVLIFLIVFVFNDNKKNNLDYNTTTVSTTNTSETTTIHTSEVTTTRKAEDFRGTLKSIYSDKTESSYYGHNFKFEDNKISMDNIVLFEKTDDYKSHLEDYFVTIKNDNIVVFSKLKNEFSGKVKVMDKKGNVSKEISGVINSFTYNNDELKTEFPYYKDGDLMYFTCKNEVVYINSYSKSGLKEIESIKNTVCK